MHKKIKHIASCGIAAEYNPFHNGHLLHLERTRSKLPDAIIIAALSANFVQRGLPAFTDKWARAKMALNNGVDLVLELPTFFSCNSGMAFAQGAVDILNAAGVSRISFGAEDPAQLKSVSCILSQESPSFKQTLKQALSGGASYSKAVALALDAESAGAGVGKYASKPNNILALSYLAHINKKGYAISPLPIKRHGGGHNESASKIRELICGAENGNFSFDGAAEIELKNLLPENSVEVMDECFRDGRVIRGNSKLFEFTRLMLLSSDKASLRKISGMDEGIEGLFLKNIGKAGSFDDFIGRCVCARYTRGRLQRQVIKMLLGIDKWTDWALQRAGARYARVLGYNGAGKKYLRAISKTAPLEFVTRLAAVKEPLGKATAQIEFRASALWELICGSRVKINEADTKPIDHS
ncbi:MAG: nucleotidyltransferase family protein [Synergistaceae bacterium]|nr:nucleotidyltransferase family protein [Synergistaceae bacterium]